MTTRSSSGRTSPSAPPILRPPSFRDFYAFEQHVATMWERRGGEIPGGLVPAADLLLLERLRDPRTGRSGVGAARLARSSTSSSRSARSSTRPAYNLPEERADEAIGGYFVLNDWSARDLQRDEIDRPARAGKGKDFATTHRAVDRDARRARGRAAAGATAPDLAMTATVARSTAR